MNATQPEQPSDLQKIVQLKAALDLCEKCLNTNFATPHTTAGRRAIQAMNVARAALQD